MIPKLTTMEAYEAAYRHSVDHPEAFWQEIADHFTWRRRWEEVVTWNFREPDIRWFVNARLNITENCLDRHLTDRGDQPALIWEPNHPDTPNRIYTYRQLYEEVCRCAHALRQLGVGKGDRVCFYMPMIPELTIGMLACARIGAIHSVVFAGFSAQALADRIQDATCKLVLCSDTNDRGARQIPVKEVVDTALARGCDSVEKVMVVRHTGADISWQESRDVWWHEQVPPQAATCEAEEMDSEDMLFILYTSGSTGKPKGVVHTCGGYMVYTGYSFRQVFQWEPGDVYFCTADIGWITGHSYIVYGPLLTGATTLMFEGVPTWPDPGRFWQIVEKHRVNQFYTAPTAIRALMAAGDTWTEGHDLSSLKVLGSVGEPINEEAWQWYHHRIGCGRVPIVDTWWQTETGGILISPLPGVTPLKPCYATYPLPGIQPCLIDPNGKEIEGNNVEGLLCMKYPWPSILRTTYGDHGRCRDTYFAMYPGHYFTGDGARRDKDGMYRIIGRVDDVINVSGHRIGTAEVENALNSHPNVVESAVVGYPHDIKGQGIYAYVIASGDVTDRVAFKKELHAVVSDIIGPIAKPDRVLLVTGLPKTRSGKIMRRILRKIASDETDSLGDTSTLLNPEVVEEIKQGALEKAV
jgi:acetyl-CoA synthetase